MAKKRKAKKPKVRNIVAYHCHTLNKPKREDDKRKKDTKHKAREIEPFYHLKLKLYF